MFHFNKTSFMKNNYIFLLLLCGSLLAGSCKKYLNVQPEGSYTETQIYGDENAIQQAFNGLYIALASNNSYGANLTQSTIEMMAQRYKPSQVAATAADLGVFTNYAYSSATAQTVFDSIWRQAYSTILATNVFLSKIDNSIQGKILSQAHGNELKGEAFAIRAMVHFDMLRLFGPVYSIDSISPAIPYYTLTDGKSQPILTASAVMANVMADYNQALSLLATDPVITTGVLNTPDFYTGYRNQRLNFYAVKALMARACLWVGNRQQAHDLALAVLTDGEKWFPWTSHDDATAATNPDRIFSSELLFAVYNPDLYTNYLNFFSPSLSDNVILAPDPGRLATVFGGDVTTSPDYRAYNSWKISGKSYPTFFKYADLTLPTIPRRFLQPIIRKSELYYALAETDPDPAIALNYMDTVTRHRGLVALPAGADIPTEIRNEFQKEFWGEGQLFFYYKRINATGVLSAAYPYPGFTVNPVYVVPLPLSETTNR
jgi:hypothetical protein